MGIDTFFERWSREMAYVLGFFAADGSMFINPRGSRYVAFYSTDKNIVEKIKSVVGVKNIIGIRKPREQMKKEAYVLQIGSKKIFNDIERLGISPNKSKVIQFPEVPKEYLSDFVRGYFDGDGNVTISEYHRKNRKSNYGRTMLAGFTSGSKAFLKGLQKRLADYAGLEGGTLYFANRAYRLYYSVRDSKKLYHFMYDNIDNLPYLSRKKSIFERY